MENIAVEYDPPGVIAAKENWIGDATEMNFIQKFLLDYEMTGNEEDFIKSSDINDWIGLQGLGITVQKFTNELKKHCVLQNLNISKKLKKINGKPCVAWFGIKRQDFFS